MAGPRNRLSRFLTDSRPLIDPVVYSPSNFYREEVVKCQRCLDAQREFYSERTITEVEKALTKVMTQLDRLCTSADADKIVGNLLQQFDTITRLSDWSDPRHIH